MRNDVVELVSPFPLGACCRALAGQIDSRWTWSRSRPLVGEMKGTWLRVRRRISYRFAQGPPPTRQKFGARGFAPPDASWLHLDFDV